MVEDKNIIRNGLKKIIREMNLPVNNIYESPNGQHALSVAAEKKPDIIITDIVMPKVNGLEFIKSAKKHNMNCQYIIISGHRDFSYAKEAISYGVYEYLLKPIEKQVLFDVLEKLILKLDGMKKDEMKPEKAFKYIDKINELKKIWIKKILLSQYNIDEISKYNDDSNIILNASGYRIITILFNCKDCEKNKNQINKYGLEIFNIIKNFFDVLFYYKIEWNYVVCIIKSEKDQNNLQTYSVLIDEHLKRLRTFGIFAYMGLSEKSDEINVLPELIQQADRVLLKKLYNYQSQVFMYGEDCLPDTELASFAEFDEIIINAVIFGKPDIINHGIDSLFQKINSIKKSPTDTLVLIIRKMNIRLSETCKKIGLNIALEQELRDALLISQSMDQLASLLKKIFMRNSQEINMVESSSNNSTIRFVLKYIEENYNKNINLESISKLVFMNPNYLSTLFKNKTGVGFVSYIQKLRIDNSKKLLLDPKMKVYEIAEMAGFNNDKYYCKVFKKITGTTPNEYRDKILF